MKRHRWWHLFTIEVEQGDGWILLLCETCGELLQAEPDSGYRCDCGAFFCCAENHQTKGALIKM